MVSKKRPGARIPKFASIEEEAEFWDSHDTTDFEGQFKPVKVRFAKELSKGITVRLDSATLELVEARAHEMGIRPSALVRLWVLERLRRTE